MANLSEPMVCDNQRYVKTTSSYVLPTVTYLSDCLVENYVWLESPERLQRLVELVAPFIAKKNAC
jgi:hypothetical protein